MLGRVATVEELFEALCLRWAREADVVYQQTGAVPPTLVVLPRDAAADEVAIRVDGLRGDLASRSAAILADLRPAVAPHSPAGLVFLSEMRLGAGPLESGTDGVGVYVSLGSAALRRAVGLRVVAGTPPSLTRAETDPPVAAFAWLDALLAP